MWSYFFPIPLKTDTKSLFISLTPSALSIVLSLSIQFFAFLTRVVKRAFPHRRRNIIFFPCVSVFIRVPNFLFPRVGDLISSQSCQSCLNSLFFKPESIPYLLSLHVLHERPGLHVPVFTGAL